MLPAPFRIGCGDHTAEGSTTLMDILIWGFTGMSFMRNLNSLYHVRVYDAVKEAWF